LSHFSRTDDWRLVNPFTIHHADQMSSGRPFMTTCVPQSIFLKLQDLKVVWSAEWLGANEGLSPARPPTSYGFRLGSRIQARADLDHNITVFRVPEGKVATFDRIASVQIMSIERGHVGGIHNATTTTGIGYSGMSSRDVPPDGLMDGEPGGLFYVDSTGDDYDHEYKGQRYLSLDVYIDDAQFFELCEQLLRSSLPVLSANAHTNIELFEYEVDSSLSEPWHRHDFGMLFTGDQYTVARTRARLQNLVIQFGSSVSAPATESGTDKSPRHATSSNHSPMASAEGTKEAAYAIRRYGRILAAIGLAIFLTLVLR
jgi:hypothetical protein